MNKKKIRSYAEIAARIEKAEKSSNHCRLIADQTIGCGSLTYPVFALQISSDRRKKRRADAICLSGGIHGNEPAGVEAILAWLENPDLYGPYLEDFDFTLLPCINPYGYEHDTRENGQGYDLNRKFDRKRPPREVEFVRRATAGKAFALSMEFHEDVDTDGFYLYEIKEKEPFFGEAIIDKVKKSCPVNHREYIEGMPSSEGVIRPPIERILNFRRKDWPQAIYLFRNGASHCITCETPVTRPIGQRAQIHLGALRAALDASL